MNENYNRKKTSKKKAPAKDASSKKKAKGKIATSAMIDDLPLPKKQHTRKPSKPVIKQRASKKEKKPAAVVKKAENLKIIPIGGLNEIGKNLTVFEYKNQILIVDCGMTFPEDELYGIDVVIPDFTYLEQNADKILGIVITHGHEDHIGGIPYLLKKINVPIYGTRLSLGLIEYKLKEHGIKGNLNTIKAGEHFKIGDYKIEAIRTTHSIADSICLYIQTPAATVFHTGDFKIDYTPIDGEPIDLSKFAQIGNKGVDIMLADSTNSTRKGYTASERVVGQTLDGIFREAKQRIIIATFSSNVHRVQKIIELAVKYNRKFAVSGRSMENVVALAVELGYLDFPKSAYVDLNKAKNIPDNEIVIITTGSQGEPMSALTRMANNEHKSVKLKKGDTVILSSTPVPGNEKTVSSVVNKLFEKEVNVIYNEIADIHVSGHACQEELKLVHTLIKPKFFMPVHGEYRHLKQHAMLAEEIGMKAENIFILENGDQLTVDKKNANKFQHVVSAEDIFVDGLGVGDVGNIVLRDRKLLSESGLIILVAAIDNAGGYIVSGPDIISRGFVYVRENEDLINDAKEIATSVIETSLDNGNKDWSALKSNVKEELRKFIYKKTKRSPVILPIFLDV